MEAENFSLLLRSMTGTRIKEIIKEYNERCKREDRSADKMKGYSKYNKEELIDFIDSFLSEDEKTEYYNKLAPNFLKGLISSAIALLLEEDKREKIVNHERVSKGIGLEIEVKGWQWENEASVRMEGGSTDRSCTCRIGETDGFCVHQMTIYLILFSNKEISLVDFPFEIKEEWLKPLVKHEKDVLRQLKTEEDADIVFSDNYRIFIDGDLVTLQWEGDYAGKKTKDISKEKDDPETWIAKKAVERLLKPLKYSDQPRSLVKDTYGIITKIMERPKLVVKILNKFQAVNPELPADEADLERFLKEMVEK